MQKTLRLKKSPKDKYEVKASVASSSLVWRKTWIRVGVKDEFVLVNIRYSTKVTAYKIKKTSPLKYRRILSGNKHETNVNTDTSTNNSQTVFI